MTCTFFGHRDSSIKIKDKLEEAVILFNLSLQSGAGYGKIA